MKGRFVLALLLCAAAAGQEAEHQHGAAQPEPALSPAMYLMNIASGTGGGRGRERGRQESEPQHEPAAPRPALCRAKNRRTWRGGTSVRPWAGPMRRVRGGKGEGMAMAGGEGFQEGADAGTRKPG